MGLEIHQDVDKGLAHALKNAAKIERKPPPPKKRKVKK
mgnify:CR=1 FL=1|tara:strand:+ start:853 stop:966 length:114 start_codon:yes stop_codon:yes gene_type:complete